MSAPRLSFQVRLNERASLSAVGTRVERALQIPLTESQDEFFLAEGEAALETTALGLWITLSCPAEVSEAEPRTFVLMGHLHDRWDADWDPEAPMIGLSAYILNLLQLGGAGAWYIPDRAELLREAGLDEEAPAR